MQQNLDAPRSSRGDLSAFDQLEAAFDALAFGPGRLALDGASFPGGELPARPIPINQVRTMLLTPGVGYVTRQRVWQELVSRARNDGPAWMVACCGMALPGLRNLAGQLVRGFRGHGPDWDAEMLAGFVEAVRSIDISEPHLVSRLCAAAYNAGRRARYADVAYSGVTVHGSHDSACPPPPAEHPDFLLARAVARRLISRLEAELIGATRLESQPLSGVAKRLGLSYSSAHRYRRRAETVIAEAIGEGELASGIHPEW